MVDQKTKNLFNLFPFLQDVQIHTDDLVSVKLRTGICAFADGGESTSIPLLIKGSIKGAPFMRSLALIPSRENNYQQ